MACRRTATKSTAPRASQIGPAILAASWVKSAAIQRATVSGAPISAASGTGTPRSRTFPGTRNGRSRSGSLKRRRTTASWAAVKAMSTPKL